MIQSTFRGIFCLTMMLTSIFRLEALFVTRSMSQRFCRMSKQQHWAQDCDYNDASLLRTALGRAMRTMSTRANNTNASNDNNTEPVSTVQTILEHVAAVTLDSRNENESNREQQSQKSLQLSTKRMLGIAMMGRAMRTMTTTTTIHENNTSEVDNTNNSNPIDNSYVTNPAITPTALAHVLWSHILRPNVDTAIDATCGNGNDSVAIASLLFTNSTSSSSSGSQSQLICIDISKKACETTRNRLTTIFDNNESIRNHCVTICHSSHSPLPRNVIRLPMNVGLVCYNLGYLPNNKHENQQHDVVQTTQMNTTIHSMTDAVFMVRVGGMVSVISYPRTNRNEDYAVSAFLKGLALLSSKHNMDWQEYIKNLEPDYPDNQKKSSDDCEVLSFTVRDTVQTALERIVEHYNNNNNNSTKHPNNNNTNGRTTTWRVMEHKLLGRALSPILRTAIRIQ